MVEFERSPGGTYKLVERDEEEEEIFAEMQRCDDAWDLTLEMLGMAPATDEPEPEEHQRSEKRRRRRRRRDREGPSVPKKAKLDADETKLDELDADETKLDADENGDVMDMEVDNSSADTSHINAADKIEDDADENGTFSAK